MSYEPRMRGTRSRRTIRKKQTTKENKNEYSQPQYYEHEEIDPQIIISNILNGIDHLGNQRFGLPPFTEHFQRWKKDVNRLITEFQTQFSTASDQQFRTAIDDTFTILNQAFTQPRKPRKRRDKRTHNTATTTREMRTPHIQTRT